MALTSPLQDGLTPGGYGTNQTQNSLTVGRGFSGTSNKAAREDHIHPINVNIHFTPLPVGAVNPAEIGVLGSSAGIGSPGRPGHSYFETTAYALANHVHAYMFADWMTSNGSPVPYKPLADGETLSACVSNAVLIGSGRSQRERIYFNFTKASERTQEGSCGIANFPARADHSHPVNAPSKSTEAAVAAALAQSSYSASDNESTTNKIGTACAAGCSDKDARADHVHGVGDNGATAKEPVTGYYYVSTLPAWNQGFNNDTWTRGDLDTSNRPCGIKMYLPVRMVGNGNDAYIRWRQFTFDQCGCLRYVGGEAVPSSPGNTCNVTMTEDEM